jgi:hypothetical protein
VDLHKIRKGERKKERIKRQLNLKEEKKIENKEDV